MEPDLGASGPTPPVDSAWQVANLARVCELLRDASFRCAQFARVVELAKNAGNRSEGAEATLAASRRSLQLLIQHRDAALARIERKPAHLADQSTWR